jgi:parallel beta-helix repeat protein
LLPAVILFLVVFTGIAAAGDEVQINEALANGGNVHLPSGVYVLEGPVIIHSNTVLSGEGGTILRVSSSSSQWFTGQTGVICNPTESLQNVEICFLEVDGNIGNLPRNFDSTPGHDRDAEKLILIGGFSSEYGNNIIIHDVKLYNAFSDGIYLRFTNNIQIYNNEIINCQHEGFFLSACQNADVYNNKVSGICSDGGRFMNSIFYKVHDNVFVSFGGDSFGAYKGGEAGLQIGDQVNEVNHGFAPSYKPFTTDNAEITGNVFGYSSEKAIHLVNLQKNANIIINSNTYLNKEQLERAGIDFDLNYSVDNLPTLEQSEKVFSSIFDILDSTISDSGYVNQSRVFNPDKTLMSKGSESAWLDVVGYTGQIKIGNDTYIPKPASESAIVVSGTKSSRDRVVRQESSKKLTVSSDNNLTVDLEVKTTYEVPDHNKISVLGKSINYTTRKKVSENTTFTKTFKAPALFPAFNSPNVSVVNFNSSHAVVSVPDLPGIVKIEYTYKNATATEYRLIGYIGSAVNGFKSTEYETIESYLFDNSGMMSRSLDGLYIRDQNFDISKLNVTVVTPYDNFHISHFEYTFIEDDHLKLFKWGFVGFIGFFYIYGRAIYKIIISVVGKWI